MVLRIFILVFLVEIILILPTQALETIKGHNQPLGSHCDSTGEVDVLDQFPLPTQFYDSFVRTGKPFIIRGELDGQKFPAYRKWTDKYLNETFGHLKVEVEAGKKDDRERGVTLKKLSEFLQTYNKSSIYLVTDLIDSWRDDVTLPVTLQCGGFQHVIDTTVMWFSSGGTKSQLHNDDTDNINCVLDGEKDVILIDKVHKEFVEADHWVVEKAYSKVDVESVDMIKFPGFQNVPWYSAKIKKGDCLFIPVSWYHQINSHTGRNMAINFWFKHLLWFNHTDCKTEKELKPRPLAGFNVTSLEHRIKDFWASTHQTEVTRPLFLDSFVFEDFALYATKQLFQFLDTNDDDKLTVDEIYKMNYKAMETYFPYIIDRFKEVFYDDMMKREEKLHTTMLDTKNMMNNLLATALGGNADQKKSNENLIQKVLEAAFDTQSVLEEEIQNTRRTMPDSENGDGKQQNDINLKTEL